MTRIEPPAGWTLRELRCFVSAADHGSFTDTAIEHGVSQAAVSRMLAGLERKLGHQLLRRGPRGCEPTSLGQQLLPRARQVLAEAQRFDTFLQEQHDTLRVGYAWAALGRHTRELQREWSQRQSGVDLELVKHNSPSAGLIEGRCDVAIVRRSIDDNRLDQAVVGLERRLVAFAADDPEWGRRRQLTMAEIAERTVLIDTRGGTTNSSLWEGAGPTPRFIDTNDVDAWLDSILAGRGVGTTAEATAHHHPRPGVTYRPIKDGPRIPVRLAWWRDARPAGLAELIDRVTALYERG